MLLRLPSTSTKRASQRPSASRFRIVPSLFPRLPAIASARFLQSRKPLDEFVQRGNRHQSAAPDFDAEDLPAGQESIDEGPAETQRTRGLFDSYEEFDRACDRFGRPAARLDSLHSNLPFHSYAATTSSATTPSRIRLPSRTPSKVSPLSWR